MENNNIYSKEFDDIKREREIMSQELYDSQFKLAERMKNGLKNEIFEEIRQEKPLIEEKPKKENKIKKFFDRLSNICQ